METATFAPSSVNAAFGAVRGVRSVRIGSIEPGYDAVEVDYDPWKVSYGALLELFWAAHDPTLDRSAIFPHTVEQHAAAVESRDRVQRALGPDRRVATAIVPASRFRPATDF